MWLLKITYWNNNVSLSYWRWGLMALTGVDVIWNAIGFLVWNISGQLDRERHSRTFSFNFLLWIILEYIDHFCIVESAPPRWNLGCSRCQCSEYWVRNKTWYNEHLMVSWNLRLSSLCLLPTTLYLVSLNQEQLSFCFLTHWRTTRVRILSVEMESLAELRNYLVVYIGNRRRVCVMETVIEETFKTMGLLFWFRSRCLILDIDANNMDFWIWCKQEIISTTLDIWFTSFSLDCKRERKQWRQSMIYKGLYLIGLRGMEFQDFIKSITISSLELFRK